MRHSWHESETALLFVYGTLRRGHAHPMARRLALSARYLGRGRVNGRLYRIDYYPGLRLSARPCEWVTGDLYDLSGVPALLARLDRYERLGMERRRRGEYARVMTQVWTAETAPRQAWVYLYRKPVARLTRLFRGDFLRERQRHPWR